MNPHNLINTELSIGGLINMDITLFSSSIQQLLENNNNMQMSESVKGMRRIRVGTAT